VQCDDARYVLDSGKNKSSAAQLFVFTRTDTFSENGDNIETVLKKQVALDFTPADSGPNAISSRTASRSMPVPLGVAFLGRVDKATLTATVKQRDSLLVALTANDRGNIADFRRQNR
jgi:hypothetical protein